MSFKPKSISIEEARKLLGSNGNEMTNRQINDILDTLRFISSKAIDNIFERRTSDN